MFIFLLIICLLTGCKTSEKKQTEESKEPVKISIILTVDPSTGMKNEQKVVANKMIVRRTKLLTS